MASAGGKKKVVVTGAGGKTGGLVIQRLAADPATFAPPVAVVRSAKSGAGAKAAGAEVVVVDITSPGAATDLAAALQGADALVVATSAVPQIKKRSILKLMLAKFTGKKGVRPEFRWKGGAGGTPEKVDWEGQKVQFDAAVAAGVRRVVLISSMGVTQPENMLNSIADGKILLWKRKAEEFLMSLAAGGKIEAVILHPGGLVDAPGGERRLVLGLDDELLKRETRRIPRADVAALAVAAIASPSAKNRSLDCVADDPAEGVAPTTDFEALFAGVRGTAAYAPLPADARV
jgi:uncharacterized protein YbjT (DUF2867 family)